MPTTFSLPPAPMVYSPEEHGSFFSVIFLVTVFLVGLISGYILAQANWQTPPLIISSESQTEK